MVTEFKLLDISQIFGAQRRSLGTNLDWQVTETGHQFWSRRGVPAAPSSLGTEDWW